MALVDTRKAKTGVFSAGRAAIAERTLRTDKWWIQPLLIVGALVAFIIYATFRAFEGKNYFIEPLVSPFYSPCLSTVCVEGSSLLGTPIGKIVIFGMVISPALFILVFPLGFRMTCYYYRKSYYRSFWASPSACAVAEPHKTYSGETRAPLILQNSHQYVFYEGLAFNVLLTIDAVLAFKNAEGEWGHMSVGTLVLLANATFLWLYSASCHTCRHTIGGRLRHFSKHPIRYKAWSIVSSLNHYHPNFAWVSLIGVAFADFYIRQVATGAFTNWYFF
jgi:hypothetical protein